MNATEATEGRPASQVLGDAAASHGRRGLQTRARLVAAGRRVFEREGYQATRVADVSAEAGVSHGTFYTYFTSKLDILRAVIESVVEEMESASAMSGPKGGSALDRIEFGNRMFFDVYRRNSRLMEIFEEVSSTEPEFRAMRRRIRLMWVRRTERSIRSMQEAGLADRSLDPTCAASVLGSMADNFAYVWLVLGEPFDEELAVNTISRLWAQAIGLAVPEDRFV